MKKFAKNSILTTLAASFIFGLVGPAAVFAATTPYLGMADKLGVLAHTFTNTTILNGTTIFGDAAYATSSGVSVFVSGTTHVNDATYLQAGADQHTALSSLNSQACTFTFAGAVDLATDISHGPLGVYTPGVYCSPGAMSIGGGGTITLNGAGTYIFRPSGALTTSNFSNATTTNGASACDIFWTPQSASTVLGSDTKFVGTVIEPVGPVVTNITVGGGTKWLGRALAFDWTVTTNPVIMKYVTITAPTCLVPPVPSTATLHVTKNVVNDDGGTAVASSAVIHVKNGAGDVAGSPAAGAGSPGTSYTLSPDTYVVSENSFAGYASSFSGDCDTNGNVTLAPGDIKTCTVTNNDIAPVVVPATLHVVKHVINNNGGAAVASSFALHVKGSGSFGVSDVAGSPAAGVEAPGTSYSLAAGTYTVSENSFTGYASSFSGDCDSSGNIALASGDNKTCTITNDDVAPIISTPTSTVITPQIISPKLPNTGIGPDSVSTPWNVAMLAGIFVFVSILSVAIPRLRRFSRRR